MYPSPSRMFSMHSASTVRRIIRQQNKPRTLKVWRELLKRKRTKSDVFSPLSPDDRDLGHISPVPQFSASYFMTVMRTCRVPTCLLLVAAGHPPSHANQLPPSNLYQWFPNMLPSLCNNSLYRFKLFECYYNRKNSEWFSDIGVSHDTVRSRAFGELNIVMK